MNPAPVRRVVDASAAVKYVLAEEWSANVKALFALTLAERRPVFGPPHVIGEGLNPIYQRVRTNRPEFRLSEQEAGTAVNAFVRLPIMLVFPRDLYREALGIAVQHSLPSTYDSLYVALAQMLRAELWTADRQLFDAVGTTAPWVRWIGDFPLTEGEH